MSKPKFPENKELAKYISRDYYTIIMIAIAVIGIAISVVMLVYNNKHEDKKINQIEILINEE